MSTGTRDDHRANTSEASLSKKDALRSTACQTPRSTGSSRTIWDDGCCAVGPSWMITARIPVRHSSRVPIGERMAHRSLAVRLAQTCVNTRTQRQNREEDSLRSSWTQRLGPFLEKQQSHRPAHRRTEGAVNRTPSHSACSDAHIVSAHRTSHCTHSVYHIRGAR